MSANTFISGSLLKTILDVAETQGVSRLFLFQQLGLEQLNSAQDQSLPFEKVIDLFELIISQTGDRTFGLRVGRHILPGSLNALGYALMSSKNLYEALLLQKSFGGAISNCAKLGINIEESLVNVSFTIAQYPPETVRSIHDMFLSMFWNYANWITRSNGQLAQVCFRHAQPDYTDAYVETFGVLPLFEQQACRLVFDKKYLDDPLYQSDESLNSLMLERTKLLLQKAKSSASLYAAVAYQVRKLMPEQKATLTLVAERLNLSERSLSRKLKEEGYSFKAVLMSVRESLALEYLRDRDLSVTDISSKLGYRDYSSFSHAFRSWTGRSPSEFRESQSIASDINRSDPL